MLKTLEIQDVSCGSCAATIRTALDLAGFKNVRVELRGKPHTVTAEVQDDGDHVELMKIVLRGHGYPLLEDPKPDLVDPTTINFA